MTTETSLFRTEIEMLQAFKDRLFFMTSVMFDNGSAMMQEVFPLSMSLDIDKNPDGYVMPVLTVRPAESSDWVAEISILLRKPAAQTMFNPPVDSDEIHTLYCCNFGHLPEEPEAARDYVLPQHMMPNGEYEYELAMLCDCLEHSVPQFFGMLCEQLAVTLSDSPLCAPAASC